MSLRIDIGAAEPRIQGIEDPDGQEFLNLVDEWCERVESAARRICRDLEGKTIEFYRDGKTVRVIGAELESVDCLMQAMVEHNSSMDTSLAGVYEVVLKRLEQQREKLHRSKKK